MSVRTKCTFPTSRLYTSSHHDIASPLFHSPLDSQQSLKHTIAYLLNHVQAETVSEELGVWGGVLSAASSMFSLVVQFGSDIDINKRLKVH